MVDPLPPMKTKRKAKPKKVTKAKLGYGYTMACISEAGGDTYIRLSDAPLAKTNKFDGSVYLDYDANNKLRGVWLVGNFSKMP